tara:strand:- start:140 stop:973 length:834 start_codon:yes stop_codon:yes gene_type:complete
MIKKKLLCCLTGDTGSLGKVIKNKNKNKNKNFKFSFYKHDIRNRKKVFEWIEKNNPDLLIHLAAIVPIKKVEKNRKYALEVNYYGTKNIVDAILKSNIKWFFFASTSHVYSSNWKKISEKTATKPASFYGSTKLKAEKYITNKLETSGIKYCIGRIFSTANIQQKKNFLVPDLIYKIKNSKKKIILDNLNHYRDFISMEKINKIIFALFKNNFSGVINIGSGKKIYLADIAKQILKKYRKNAFFIKNKTQTTFCANNTKLKKYYKAKVVTNLKEIIS